jgi:hypothetical protein
VLPTVMVAAVAAAAGYMLGHHSEKAGIAPAQKTVAARPITQSVSKPKTMQHGGKPDLALKSDGEAAEHIPAPMKTKPETPPIVLLNPGTADPKGNVRDRAITPESRAAPTRGSAVETAQVGNNKPRDQREAGSRNSMRDYRDLRDYMLGR